VLLRQSIVQGYSHIAHVLKDSDLDPLRRRADYAALLVAGYHQHARGPWSVPPRPRLWGEKVKNLGFPAPFRH
jgi:hypothetical protein